MATIISRSKKSVVVYSYVDNEKKRKQKWDSFLSRAEAFQRKKFVEYYQSVHGSVIVPDEQNLTQTALNIEDTGSNNVTFSEYLKEYVDVYGRANWSVTTFRNKTSLIRNYIDPIIGDKKIDQISTRMLSKYYVDLLNVKEAAGNKPSSNKLLTPANIKKIHDLIRSALKQAIAWDILPKIQRIQRQWQLYQLFQNMSEKSGT